MRKLGAEALEELNEEVAKGCSVEMKERGVDDALKFAMDYGVVNKKCAKKPKEQQSEEIALNRIYHVYQYQNLSRDNRRMLEK